MSENKEKDLHPDNASKKYNKHSVDGLPYLSELSPDERIERLRGETIQRAKCLIGYLDGTLSINEMDIRNGYENVYCTTLLLSNQMAFNCKKMFKESFNLKKPAGMSGADR
jgi:hypothetical protein